MISLYDKLLLMDGLKMFSNLAKELMSNIPEPEEEFLEYERNVLYAAECEQGLMDELKEYR